MMFLVEFALGQEGPGSRMRNEALMTGALAIPDDENAGETGGHWRRERRER